MRYEYVTVKISHGFFSNENCEHREIIDEYAAKGYRYAGWLPRRISNVIEGLIEEVDLIFETDD